MGFGTIEILALVLIVISVVKLIIIAVNPHCWFSGVAKLYACPVVGAVVPLVLAAIVLYFLVTAGITIIQILAVTLFIALLIMVGIAPHAEGLITFMKDNAPLSRDWLYIVVWLVLLAWGVKELFFA